MIQILQTSLKILHLALRALAVPQGARTVGMGSAPAGELMQGSERKVLKCAGADPNLRRQLRLWKFPGHSAKLVPFMQP